MPNSYHVDDFEVHNEPDNASQGWGGTLTDYYEFMHETADAINYVYSTYLPGRTPHVYAPVTKGGSTWPDSVMKNAGSYFDSLDIHNYNSDTTSYERTTNTFGNIRESSCLNGHRTIYAKQSAQHLPVRAV